MKITKTLHFELKRYEVKAMNTNQELNKQSLKNQRQTNNTLQVSTMQDQ